MWDTMVLGCRASGCSEILGDGCLGEPMLFAVGDSGNSDAAVELWMPYNRYTAVPARLGRNERTD